MKALLKRKGNVMNIWRIGMVKTASMKALLKRKGNTGSRLDLGLHLVRLNESPSEKEGKSECKVRRVES